MQGNCDNKDSDESPEKMEMETTIVSGWGNFEDLVRLVRPEQGLAGAQRAPSRAKCSPRNQRAYATKCSPSGPISSARAPRLVKLPSTGIKSVTLEVGGNAGAQKRQMWGNQKEE